MCGIWGLIGKKEDPSMIKKTIDDLFLLSESRGKEAAGIACVKNHTIESLKEPVPASKLIKSREYVSFLKKLFAGDNTFISAIGHSRLVTNGSETNISNNQPVVEGNIATVHNGIIVNSDTLWEMNKQLLKTSDLDTEVFVKLISGKRNNRVSDLDSVKYAYSQIQGTASTLTLFSDTNSIISATNNGSLYFWRSNDRALILFASERNIFRELYKTNRFIRNRFSLRSIVHLKDGKGVVINAENMTAKRFIFDKYKVIKEKSEKKLNSFRTLEIKYKQLEIDIEPIKEIRRCTRCVLPATMPYIEFDDEGVCNYCRSYERMHYKGIDSLVKWSDNVKTTYNNKEYNSIVSFSGGRDSSYGLHYFVKKLGLKPVAYNYDWGMVTDLARRNQARMCAALGVELITVSADIKTKRENIRKNILAWIKKPDVGMVPLFMAGDKAYFYYANVMKKRFGLDSILLASNPFEVTHFKSGFCGIKPYVLRNNNHNELEVEQLKIVDSLKMALYYSKQYLNNHRYINTSLIDTAYAAMSYYAIPHDYFRLYDYIPWDESEIDDVLINEYDWETAGDTDSTWRIGDGTAPFYNYIYYYVCGFTENDTLRSNQIREGKLERSKALELVYRDNQPRWESLEWYFNTVNLSMTDILLRIKAMKRLY